MAGNVPATERPSSGNVPSSEAKASTARSSAGNVPATKPKVAAAKAAVSDGAVASKSNMRPYTGQQLGVRRADGKVDTIDERFLDLATVGRSRILDRAPISGLEIVIID